MGDINVILLTNWIKERDTRIHHLNRKVDQLSAELATFNNEPLPDVAHSIFPHPDGYHNNPYNRPMYE